MLCLGQAARQLLGQPCGCGAVTVAVSGLWQAVLTCWSLYCCQLRVVMQHSRCACAVVEESSSLC